MRKLIIILIAVLCSSCEKVIDLKLNTTEPKIVIEAIFTDLNVRHSFTISSTSNFDQSNTKIPVTGAKLTLTEENGPTLSFIELTPGTYTTAVRYKGIPGKKYTLSVIADGKTYTATSIMPVAVPIKTLNQAELTFFKNTRKIVQINYTDPLGIPNYYYNRVFVNGVKREDFSVDSDRFNDGKEVKNTIFIGEPDLVKGDVVRVQFLTIDVNVYRYLFSITQITGNGGPPTTPANPNSNFNNGALGFFSASSSTEQTIVIE
ncbi:DUF4249 domain-containing protein [Pedobacter sp. Du54]|uniref:DUF4249 domain-containing protein n=1 Tax=Pedobacter anseongensis TaxID=3133439 RepID=UPI00309F17BF